MKTKINFKYVQETMKFLKEVKSDISYECDTEPPVTEKYLHKCQLLNVMKLSPKLDVYMAVEDGFIHIIDKDMKVLHQIKVDFDYYAGQEQFNYVQAADERKSCLTKILLQSVVMCKGYLYFQAFNLIYKLSNTNLEVVGDMPVIDLDYFEMYPQSLFNVGEEISMKSSLYQFFMLHNNKLKFRDVAGSYEFQFCDNTVQWSDEDYNVSISKNMEHLKQFDTPVSSIISFCQSGVIIVHSEECFKVYIIDFINCRMKELENDQRFGYENIINHITIGGAGIQLKDEILVELFDAEFPAQIRRVYDEHLEKCVQEYPGLGVQLNQLIESAKDQLPADYESRLNVIPEKKIAKRPKPEVLNDFQLMNVVKLRADLDLYLVVEDNYIYIVNQEQKVFGKYWVNYDMYPGYHSEKYYEGEMITNYSCQYNATIFNGEIYIMKFEAVFKISNRQLVYVASIPGYDQDTVKVSVYFNTGLFVKNNNLYAFTDNGNVFQLIDQKFVYQFNDDKQFYQFCDQVITYDRCSNQFQTLEGETILDLSVKKIQFIINQGGVIVFLHSPRDKQKQYFLVDFVNNNVKQFSANDLYDFNILCSSKILGPAGIEVKQKDVVEILGGDLFRKQVYDHYGKFIRKQEQLLNWNREVNQLLTFNVLSSYFRDRFNTKLVYYRKQLTGIYKNAKTMIKYVRIGVNRVITDSQVFIEKFNSVFNASAIQ
ncbi:Conserved_hypothetical protein [Hexamita inflata]|uniref:Uncharacterized protein n=1 Tax=Hexamita inflata TaxID=28002 RepID=A0AA86QH03_9EUKA|nr:Conserved hypothetical protein [Hexamita inflata]